MNDNKTKVINNNSDIFSFCKCGTKFHKFFRTVNMTLRAHLMQKKSPLFGIPRQDAKDLASTPHPSTICAKPVHQGRRQFLKNRRRHQQRRFFI